MARLLGPDSNNRLIYQATAGLLRSASGKVATVYADAAGTVLANIAAYNPEAPGTPGSVISGSILTVDAFSLLPRFWFPDGVDTVYVTVGGGPLIEMHADYDSRVDTLTAGLAGEVAARVAGDAAALPLSGGTLAGDLVILSTTAAQRRLSLSSYFETDSLGTAETIRLHTGNPLGKTGNSSKNAIAWYDDAIDPTTSQVWVQAHDYLHWYNVSTFAAAAVNTATNRITVTSHGLPSSPGWQVQLSTTGTLPAPLALATNYYAKRIDNNTLEIYTDAALSSIVDLTDQGSGTHTITPDNTWNNNRHRHFSVEVSNADLANKNTRFSIPWGYDVTEIGFFQAKINFHDYPVRIIGPAGSFRQLVFCNTLSDNLEPDGTEGRFSVQINNTAEAGSNVGSDFRVVRYTDAGVAVDAPLFIKRSNGQVGIGGVTAPGASLDVGPGTTTVSARVNRGANASFSGSYVLATSGTDQWSLQLRNDSTNDLHVRNSVQGFTALLVEQRATAPNISLLTGTKSYGSGVGVIFVANVSTPPSGNPVGGGLIYVESGALKFKGSSGTITTLGAA